MRRVLANIAFNHAYLATIVFFLGCGSEPSPANDNVEDPQLFTPIENTRMTLDDGASRGVAWADFDADGDSDLFVTNANGQWNYLYRNEGDKGFHKLNDSHTHSFAIAANAGGNSQGVNWVDFDNDGDLDLYINNRGDAQNFLFRNDSLKTFARITDSPLTQKGMGSSMSCWADIDADGDLDVLLIGYRDSPNKLFENLGAASFKAVNSEDFNEFPGRGRACACGDLNNDGLPDFYIANARRPNGLFINKGNWKFKKVLNTHEVTDVAYSYGASFADFDNDGDMDLFLANFDKENYLYANKGEGILERITQDPITTEQGGASKGHAWGDYDLDGDLDLAVGNGTYAADMQNFLFWNTGEGKFEKDTVEILTQPADTTAGVAWTDYDLDGDLDLFFANWGGGGQPNRFYRNEVSAKQWIGFRLRGIDTNFFGIGTRVVLEIEKEDRIMRQSRWMYPITGYASQNDYLLHFGLGIDARLLKISIFWPSGKVDHHKPRDLNTYYLATEGQGLNAIDTPQQ